MPQQERNFGFDPEQDPAPPTGRSWFFGVGVNTYQHFPSLNNARKDIEDVLQLLRQRYQLDEGITLFDEAATRQAVIDQLYALQGQLKENDKLIIFYSGHGHLDRKGRGYWIPADAAPKKISSYIPSSTIQYLVEDIGCRHILLVSDSCFSGALLTRDLGYAQQALEELERDRSRWVIASGRGQEPVADGKPGENSPFAGSILKVLRDNQQMRLNAGLLFDQVAKLTRFKYKQMPQSAALYGSGHEGGQYVFHLKVNEAADWKACQEAGTVAAYQSFLANYPEGMYAQAARTTLAELAEEAAWEEARSKDTILSYYQYNQQYPSGKHRSQALEALKRLEEKQAWQKAQRADTLSAFLDYQGRYQQGRFAQEAEARIQSILAAQQEPSAWQAAKAKGTAAAYEAFLQQYPQSPHAPEARAAMREWQQKAEKERAQQEERARRQKREEVERQRREQEAAQPKEPEAARPLLSRAPAPESGRVNRKKWLPIAVGALLGVLMVWGILKIVNRDNGHLADEPAQDRVEDTTEQAATPEPTEKLPKVDNPTPSEEKQEPPSPPQLSHRFPGNDQLRVRLSEGAPPYTLLLLRRGKEVYRKEQLLNGSHNITLTEYRQDVGSYELQVEDANGQQASQTIRIDPPPQKVVEQPAAANSTAGTARLGGRTYRTVRLNGKTWMAENLNYEVADSWCYDDKSGNCDTYGRLYTWEAAKKACQAVGWRLPTDAEWKALIDQYGNSASAYQALTDGDFAALLGGGRNSRGEYLFLGRYGYYWSATAYGTGNAWGYDFNGDGRQVGRLNDSRWLGLSCRCFKD